MEQEVKNWAVDFIHQVRLSKLFLNAKTSLSDRTMVISQSVLRHFWGRYNAIIMDFLTSTATQSAFDRLD